MPLSLWIAFRYLKSRKAGRYAPLLTATAILSIVIGMFALIVVMSVMRGFKQELTDRLLGFNAHITLNRSPNAAALTKDDVKKLFDESKLRDIAPFVQGEVIAESHVTGELLAQGARVRGIDPAEQGVMQKVHFYFPEDAPEKFGAVIGSEIVSQLTVYPDFGDSIRLVAPLADVLPNGELGPNTKEFNVSGVFKTGVFDLDSKYILVPYDDAVKLLGEQKEEGWQIRLKDLSDIPSEIKKAKNLLPEGYSIESIADQNKKLFAALRLERIAMGGVLFMVMLIASFAIMGVILLVTSAKRKDMAILSSIGMGRRMLSKIFFSYAALIGLLGSLGGFVLGLSLCAVITRWPIKLPTSYYLDTLPVEISVGSAFVFAAVGVLIAVVSSFYPVRSAIKLNPCEILRYE